VAGDPGGLNGDTLTAWFVMGIRFITIFGKTTSMPTGLAGYWFSQVGWAMAFSLPTKYRGNSGVKVELIHYRRHRLRQEATYFFLLELNR